VTSEATLSIAEEFTPFPAGRYASDGDFSGEEFRKRLLMPKLKDAIAKNGILTVKLDGLKSCGSSFLNSAFGGLIADEGMSRSDVKNHLIITCESKALERYKIAIFRHIDSAKVRR
jgi:hypothetical protein